MTRLLLLAACLIAQPAVAQSLSPFVIASAGQHTEAGGFMLSYTVGETAVKTVTADNYILTQGFHQPNDGPLSVTHITLPHLEIKTYPNPATDDIGVWVTCTSSAVCANVRITLHDLLGRELAVPASIASQANTLHYAFDLRALAASVYFIRVMDEQAGTSQTVKFTRTSL